MMQQHLGRRSFDAAGQQGSLRAEMRDEDQGQAKPGEQAHALTQLQQAPGSPNDEWPAGGDDGDGNEQQQ